MVANGDMLSALGPQLELLLPELDEKGRRLTLGAVALATGDGGVSAVARLTGASWQTVADGAAELASGDTAPPGRVRRPGGGRKKLADTDPGLVPALLGLVGDSTRGDPESPLQWTTKSLRNLADALTAQGHRCSPQTVRLELRNRGYSLQAPAKVLEGTRHPDRDAQFRYIAGQAKEHQKAGQPVLSLDAKKKEEVGDYAQPGREWHPAGQAPEVLDHSFPDRDGPGHAIPYGVYDTGANSGFVNVGTDANTGEFAVASLRRWHDLVGKNAYPDATRLLLTCDSGSSNGIRNRAWKKELARFAAGTGLEITVCHFPPGTSKWNKIEHRLFSRISLAWRGRPLTSYDVIINTIGTVTTKTGLTAAAVLDTRPYPAGKEISDAEIRDIEERYLNRHPFHGEWNYTILPQPRPARPAPEPDRPPRVPFETPNHPALTGMDPRDLLDWTESLHDLITALGGPGRTRRRRGSPPRLTAADLVAATRIMAHLGISKELLAPFLGVHATTFGQALPPVTRALAGAPPPPAAPPLKPLRPRAPSALIAYAAGHGIDLTTPPPRKLPTAPGATLETPGTPQTHFILERLHSGGNAMDFFDLRPYAEISNANRARWV
jgi:Rhodopirellula transposase DDE domain